MGYVARLTRRSEDMLDATLRGDVATMAEVIEAAHDQEVPLLRYANEADLAALVNLVYLAARDRYAVRREEPAGKGVADVTFIPAISPRRAGVLHRGAEDGRHRRRGCRADPQT